MLLCAVQTHVQNKHKMIQGDCSGYGLRSTSKTNRVWRGHPILLGQLHPNLHSHLLATPAAQVMHTSSAVHPREDRMRKEACKGLWSCWLGAA